MAEVKVTGLNVFPIKSCKGCHVDEITIDGYGVIGDRRFMLVDGRGRFISQRKYPKLATVTVQWIDNNQVLHVTNPGMDRDLKIIPKEDGERIETTIWEDTVMTIDQGDEASQWFSQFLGLSGNYIRLVTSAEKTSGFNRVVTNLPDSLKGRLPPMKIALADAGPVSMISNESLSDLNERLREQSGGHEVPLTRFRMNVEIAGCGRAFEEDEWLVIRIGSIPLLVYTAAERCKMTGINQDTGEEDKLGPLEILRQYRAPKGPTHTMFGQLMIPLQAGGKIKIGDVVTVLDKKK